MAALSDERSRLVEHVSELAPDPIFHIEPPEFDEIEEEPEEQRVAIRILVFQQIDYYVSLWVANTTTPADIISVEAAMLGNQIAYDAYEAEPQLPDDVLTVCIAPRWWEQAGKVPVVLSHNSVYGLPFVGVVPKECSLSDILGVPLII